MRRAALALGLAWACCSTTESYRGIEVVLERRCTPYDRSDCRYPESLEAGIVVDRPGVRAVYRPLL